MSAELFGDRFIGARTPAWHGLGQVFQDPITAVEAISRAKLDYKVERRPVLIFQQNADGDRSVVEIPNRYALVRERTDDDPVERVFSIVSDQYEVIQNLDVARSIEPLTEKWPVETAGALGYGERTFLVLDAGEIAIRGDLVHQYFLISDAKTGTEGLKIAFTPVRVVCQNTLTTGLRQASVQLTLSHVSNFSTQLDFSLAALRKAQQAQVDVVAVLADLAERQVSELVARDIIEKVYRAPKGGNNKFLSVEAGDGGSVEGYDFSDPVLRALVGAKERQEFLASRMKVYQGAALELYHKFNDEQPALAGTKWALWNAIVETEDYRRGSTSAPANSVNESLLFGTRARTKARAFTLVNAAESVAS